jgi:hypothetical protein
MFAASLWIPVFNALVAKSIVASAVMSAALVCDHHHRSRRAPIVLGLHNQAADRVVKATLDDPVTGPCEAEQAYGVH